MAPLVLEGATLGKRHQHYNQLLKDVPTSEAAPAKIDYLKTDIENLFNVDIACKNRNVEYILDVLKGEDMLYVSRAIKGANWLITEPQFAHIIEPEYLHSQLFPQMMPKASNKLLLQIRLTLKDESRVCEFYQYYQEKDLKTAIKWLPNCPVSVIEKSIKKHHLEISPDVFGRLCRRSPKILKVFAESTNEINSIRAYLAKVMFLINTDTELYLDVVEKMDKYFHPKLKRKYTDIMMKMCPQRIVNNFEKYSLCIHVDTFAKNLKKEDIKTFIRTHLENTSLESWFDEETLAAFIKYIPKEDKAEFMKQCIEKIETQNDAVGYKRAMRYRIGGSSNSSAYRWYKYASFDVAFPELKNLIRAESNPDERKAMLMLLVENARNNEKNIKTLLQHYKEKHINEPFIFKVQFVNQFIQKTDPKVYNEDIWGILDELFRSMEVYIESQNNVQTCIKALIVHKVTHDQAVPDIIQKKFVFDELKRYEKKLKGTQRDKVFNYLFNLILIKLDGHVITHQTEFIEYVDFLKQGLHLLNIWKKDLVDYPLLINKIKDCVKTRKEKGWSTSLTYLYDIKKSWKRDLFEESLALFPSEGVCVNALKHDPELLVRYKDELDTVRYNDTTPMERVLHRLRVYWPQTLAREWMAGYCERLDKTGGHKALVRGLYCLFNQQQLLEFLRTYEPQQSKINWTDVDELQVSLHKNIAQNMHIARPQVMPDAVLWYAKGDYVQFVQPALNSILYNLRSTHSHDCVLKLLNGTVSLQKHGIRLAFAKLSSSDMNKIFEDVWKTTKNSSIRALLFQNINKVLCKEQDETMIAEIWKLMQYFIDSLSAVECRTLYYTFGNLAKIHQSIKPAYCMKSYKFLKSLSPKIDCKNVIQKIKDEMPNIVNELDSDFVTSIIEEYTNEVLVKHGWEFEEIMHDINFLSSYLLSAGDEKEQTARFNKVFVPLIDKFMASWNKIVKRQVVVKANFEEIIKELMRLTPDYFVYKNKAKPSTLYINILQKLESKLPVTQNMILFRQLKLGAAFVNVLEKNKSTPVIEESQLQELYLTSLEDLIKIIIQYLKEDVAEYDTLVYLPFTAAVKNVFHCFGIQSSTNLKCIRRMLNEKDFVPLYLVAFEMLPTVYPDDTKQLKKEIWELLTSHPSPLVQLTYH